MVRAMLAAGAAACSACAVTAHSGNAAVPPCTATPAITRITANKPIAGQAVSFYVEAVHHGGVWTPGVLLNGVPVKFRMRYTLTGEDPNTHWRITLTLPDYLYVAGASYKLTFQMASDCGTASRSISWPTAACVDILIIDVHGSDEQAYEISPTGNELATEIRDRTSGKKFKVITVPFKAAGGWPTLTGAALKLPAGYHKSVMNMKSWLRKTMDDLSRDCPSSALILTGYSQGAQAAGDVYQEREEWPQIVGVALFGDPYYNHKDSSDRFGLNVKPRKRMDNQFNGGLAMPRPRKPFDSSKVLSFCHQWDPVCQNPLNAKKFLQGRPSEHNNYTEFSEPETAAKYFAKLLAP
jgi:hypothetical protein